MKKLLLLCLAVAAGFNASAQQKGKTNYMSISIFRSGARITDLIVTRTDSAQVRHEIKVKLDGFAGGAKAITEEDDALMTLLKPYFNSGWKLVSFTDVADTGSFTEAYRYFLSREE